VKENENDVKENENDVKENENDVKENENDVKENENDVKENENENENSVSVIEDNVNIINNIDGITNIDSNIADINPNILDTKLGACDLGGKSRLIIGTEGSHKLCLGPSDLESKSPVSPNSESQTSTNILPSSPKSEGPRSLVVPNSSNNSSNIIPEIKINEPLHVHNPGLDYLITPSFQPQIVYWPTVDYQDYLMLMSKIPNTKFSAQLVHHASNGGITFKHVCLNMKLDGRNIKFDDAINSFGNALYAFDNNIESAELPQGLSTLNFSTFESCSSLSSLKLNSNLKHIESYAIANCPRLVALKLPDGLKTIDPYAFSYCNIRAMKLPDSVEFIDKGCFKHCSNLAEIHLSKSIKNIPECCFESCRQLSKISVSSSLVYLDQCAFKNCYSLTKIKIRGVNETSFNLCASESAFMNCRGIYWLDDSKILSGELIICIKYDYAITNIDYFKSLMGLV